MKYIFTFLSLLLSISAFAATPKFQLYDVVKEHYISIRNGETADKIIFSSEKESRQGAEFYTVKLKSLDQADRGIRLSAYIPFSRENSCFSGEPYLNEKVVPGKKYSRQFGGMITSKEGAGFSRYPCAGMSNATDCIAIAIAIDPSYPAMSYLEYDADKEQFFIHFELGFIPEHSEAEVRFCIYPFDRNWGFRSILDRYYKLFPADFKVRSKDQGICIPFAEPSRIANIEDFTIRYRETSYEGKWNYDTVKQDFRHIDRVKKEIRYGNTKNIIAFRYHEPGTFWLPLKKGFPQTYEKTLEYTKQLARKGHTNAQKLIDAGMINPDGKYQLFFSKQTWNDGCVWAISTLPGIIRNGKAGNPEHLEEKLKSYKGEEGELFAGEFYDSMGGYMRGALDFNRNNMAKAKYPLVYDYLTGKVAASQLLCQTEYAKISTDAFHNAKKMTMANNVRSFLLSRFFDSFVGEFNWKLHKKWVPTPPEQLFFIRSLLKGKSYTMLQKTTVLSEKETDHYMRLLTAYGIFPGFFSVLPHSVNYYRKAEFHDKDRNMFKKYLPICKRLSEAGWEPITKLRSSTPEILTERFGSNLFTVYNNSKKSLTFKLQFEDSSINTLHSLANPEQLFKGDKGLFSITLPMEGALFIEAVLK